MRSPGMNLQFDLRNNSIDRLRLASILDGISYLILLGIAMPLKYLAGMWMAVRMVGSIHGGLFLALCRDSAVRNLPATGTSTTTYS